jgi:hypothetical protein
VSYNPRENFMKEQILTALAEKWERDAAPPNCEDSSNEAASAFGFRKAQAQCADQLRQLIKLLGEDDVFDGRAMMVKGL